MFGSLLSFYFIGLVFCVYFIGFVVLRAYCWLCTPGRTWGTMWVIGTQSGSMKYKPISLFAVVLLQLTPC